MANVYAYVRGEHYKRDTREKRPPLLRDNYLRAKKAASKKSASSLPLFAFLLHYYNIDGEGIILPLLRGAMLMSTDGDVDAECRFFAMPLRLIPPADA